MISALSWLVGALIGVLIFWLVDAPARRRRREDRAHLDECNRHTRIAAEALKDGNEEKYEVHMVLAIAAFDRISISKKKGGKA